MGCDVVEVPKVIVDGVLGMAVMGFLGLTMYILVRR